MGILVVSQPATITFPSASSLASVLPGGVANAGDVITFTIVTTYTQGSLTIAAGQNGSLLGPSVTGNLYDILNKETAATPRVVTIRFTSSTAYTMY